MKKRLIKNHHVATHSRHQQLFLRFTFAVLVDLTVLNLFNEFWDLVHIELFSISLLAAILLQVLLQVTLKIEHYVGEYFKKFSSLKAKILRGLSTWAILFVSKLIILKALSLAFGEALHFSGPIHGVLSFIVVVIAIIIAEQFFTQIYKYLGHPDRIDYESELRSDIK